MTIPALDAAAAVWRDAGLPEAALRRLHLAGAEPALPSSFAVGTAAQASLGVAALAASEIGRRRSDLAQEVAVDMREAAIECSGAFRIDGRAPELWDPIAGLYPCGPNGAGGFLRLHTNFAHHRDGVLRLLGLPTGAGTPRAAVEAALAHWTALDFESRAVDAGLVVAALRDFETWDAHPQRAAIAGLPLVEIARIGDARPLPWPSLAPSQRPLAGLRVLDLTRILAGPVAGRTLAAYGADVMLVNSPHLPNIEAIADTSRGKRSALADLRDAHDRAAFGEVLAGAHVFMQGYRPGSLAALGFGSADAARIRPGVVCVSLSAYGRLGPWSDRRGFDSLVQTATGFNVAEGEAATAAAAVLATATTTATPGASIAAAVAAGPGKPLPVQILDMASGFLMAFGAEAALLRQHAEGGSWHVQVSLARTALWLRSLGRVESGFAAPAASYEALMESSESGFGRLRALRHSARFSATPARYERRSVPPGSDRLSWS